MAKRAEIEEASLRAERREALRAQLAATVTEMLSEGAGVAEITVDGLMARLDLPRSTFYVYFENRAEFLGACVEAFLGPTSEITAAWWLADHAPTRSDVGAGMAAVVTWYAPHALLMGAIYDTVATDPKLAAQFADLMVGHVDRLAAHIATGQQAGWVDASLPAEAAAGWIAWMFERCIQQEALRAADAELGTLADSLADTVWRALYAPAMAAA